jgi:hypothetical protein
MSALQVPESAGNTDTTHTTLLSCLHPSNLLLSSFSCYSKPSAALTVAADLRVDPAHGCSPWLLLVALNCAQSCARNSSYHPSLAAFLSASLRQLAHTDSSMSG